MSSLEIDWTITAYARPGTTQGEALLEALELSIKEKCPVRVIHDNDTICIDAKQVISEIQRQHLVEMANNTNITKFR